MPEKIAKKVEDVACKIEEASMKHSITLPNDIETIPQLNAFIDGVCEKFGIDLALSMSLNLAIEEAVVNVMEYAYPDGKKGKVDIEAFISGDNLKIVISDSGVPFDPTQNEEIDTTLSVEERPIGGLGIHLVREIMDSISYKYKDKKNIFTLNKKIK